MKHLSGVDSAFLHLESPEMPMHIGSLNVLDLPEGYNGDFFEDTKAMLAQRLHLADVFTRKLALMPLVTAVIVGVFGGLTLWLHDDTFIKMKPTIVNSLFGTVLLGGMLFGQSLLRYVFGDVYKLQPKGWTILTLRWGLFFFFLAVLNEVVWRTQTTDFWVAFKAFGAIPLTMGFALAQMPLIKRYHLEPASLQASEAEAGDVRNG